MILLNKRIFGQDFKFNLHIKYVWHKTCVLTLFGSHFQSFIEETTYLIWHHIPKVLCAQNSLS